MRLENFLTLPIVDAVVLRQFLSSGRTRPCVMECEGAEGETGLEYVVKLKDGPETNGYTSMAFEIVGSRLADYFGILVPEPALVQVTPEFVRCINHPENWKRLNNSIGLNFGSTMLSGGYTSWPLGQKLDADMLAPALRIFAFDAIIQNPDRKTTKPNVLVKGNSIYAIDHEMAFSFILAFPPVHTPWIVSEERYMKNHVFYDCLKGKDLDFDAIGNKLESCDEVVLERIMMQIPEEWEFAYGQKIKDHVLAIRENKDDFILDLRGLLA